MKRLLVAVVLTLAACGGGGHNTTTSQANYATAKDAADAAGCGGFTDTGPEPPSSIAPNLTLATDQGTCTLDGASLKFSVYASQRARQNAESAIILIGKSFLSNDAHIVAGSGANVIVDHAGKSGQVTPPDVEKIIRKVADKLHLGIMEITGKTS